MNLAKLKCVACRGGDLSLTDAEIAELLPQVPEWQTVAQDGILRLHKEQPCKTSSTVSNPCKT